MSRETTDPLELLRECGGFYECPKDALGNRLGPLVGYAGKYDGGKQYVGDVYANFAAAESHPRLVNHFAHGLWIKLSEKELILDTESVVMCGAPEGGKTLAAFIGLITGCRYIYPEKKVTALATPTVREQSEMVFSRHEPREGDQVILVEDVCNNFSTTELMIRLIESYGAKVLAVACFLNRSMVVDDTFLIEGAVDKFDGVPNRQIPVVSLVRKAFGQFRQDDPQVATDIAAGRVVLKPKNEWDKLMAAMSENPVP